MRQWRNDNGTVQSRSRLLESRQSERNGVKKWEKEKEKVKRERESSKRGRKRQRASGECRAWDVWGWAGMGRDGMVSRL